MFVVINFKDGGSRSIDEENHRRSGSHCRINYSMFYRVHLTTFCPDTNVVFEKERDPN